MMAVEEEEVKEVLQKLQELVDQLYSFRECYLLKKEKKKKLGDKCVRFPIYLSPTYLRWLRKIATYRLNAKCEL